MSSNNNTATTDDTTTATENFEQNDAVLALQQLGARVQPQQPRQPQQQQQQLQQEGTSSGTAATAAHRPSSQQQQQQQRNTIEGLRDDQLRRLQRLHHSAKERSQRGPTRQAQLMYEREQREQQKQQQHELLLMHLHGIIPPPLPVGLQGILGGTNVGLGAGAGAGAGLSLSSMAEHQELLLMNLHGIGPPPPPLHPPAYTPLPIGMMFPGSTISNAIIGNNSNNYDNIVRNSNILVLQQQQQIAAITSAIDIDESQCSSQSVPPLPLLLTDLKPGILTIFKRLIKEHSIQYEYFVTNNIISIRREIPRNDRVIRFGDMGANGIIDQVYYELHRFCSPYPNLMLEFPSKIQFDDLIRSSLEYECEVQQRLRQQQGRGGGGGGGGGNSKKTYNNENTIGSLLPSIYVEQNSLFKKTEKEKVPTLTPPSSSILASTVSVYPSASLSCPSGISSRIGTGVGVGFVPPTATSSSAPHQLPTVPITTMTTSKFPICQFRFPMEMYQDVDKRFVSPFECLLRKELLIFEADKDDVLLSSQSRIIKVGQVGLRCRHCVCSARHIDRSTWYPKSLKEMDTMFDAIFEQHFLKNCTLIPKRLKLELKSMQQARKDFYLHDLDNPFGDSYWSEQLITLGVYEDGIDTLRVNRGERNASILFAAAAAAATGVVVAPAHYVNASTVVAPVTIGSNNELRQRSIVQQQSPHRVSAINANVIIPDIQQQPTHKKEVVRSNADPNNGNKKAPTKKDNKARRPGNFKKEQKSSFSVSAVDGNSATITPPDSKGAYSMSQQDLDLCRGLIKKLRSKNNSKFNSPFLFPFHPSETPGYLDICSCRTDISTISHKLENGAYSNRSKFYDACNMIFTNALKYHSDKPKTQWVILRAERMLEIAKMEQEKIENKVTAGTTTQKTSVPAKETLELLAQDLVRPSASGTDPPSNTAAVPVIQDPDTGTGTGVIPDRILSKAAQRVLKRLAPFNSAGITTEGDNKYILGRALTISTERRRRASAPNFNSLASAGKGKNRKSSSVTLKKKSRTALLASSKTECNDDIDNDNNKKRKATFPPSKISTKKNTTRNGVIGASATDGEDNGDSGPPFKRGAASSRVEAESEEEIPTPSIQMKNDKLDESVEKCLPKSVRRALKNLAPFNDPSSTTDSSALASSSRLRLKRTRNSL